MPLIVFSGLPSSGKTTRALRLQKMLEDKIASSQQKFKVHVINDDTLGINREVYRGTQKGLRVSLTRDAKREKAARATFYSAVQRALSKDDIVIADGMNYIKGFRYQLFCEAKALATPHCVVTTPPFLLSLTLGDSNGDTSTKM
jgi:protein KTI12